MDLLLDGDEVRKWIKATTDDLSSNNAFGKITSGVVWTDDTTENGEPLVEADPAAIVDEINGPGLPLLRGHDPGAPAGRVLAAKIFSTAAGRTFVAAVAGFYSNETQVTFSALGVDCAISTPSPPTLPSPPHFKIIVAADPREVPTEWLDSALHDAPAVVQRTELSHNAAEPLHDLVRIGLPYILLVWNPFVTSVASEAGKATYAALHQWVGGFLKRIAERRNSIVELQSFQHGCQVSFLFRGNNLKALYAAHDKRPAAAAQAAQVIEHLTARGGAPRTLTYEFDGEANQWYPSYAELYDGRIVSDRQILIAFEQFSSGLSLGLTRY